MEKPKRMMLRITTEILFDKSTGAVVMRILRYNKYRDIDIYLNLSEVKALHVPLNTLEGFDVKKFNDWYSIDAAIFYDGVRWYNVNNS